MPHIELVLYFFMLAILMIFTVIFIAVLIASPRQLMIASIFSWAY